MAKDRYGESLGIWKVDIGGADLELHPEMADFKELRNIMISDELKNNRQKKMDTIEEFILKLIRRDFPQDDINRQKEYITLNSNDLFEEVLIKFRLVKKEELEEGKKEVINQAKKLIESN